MPLSAIDAAKLQKYQARHGVSKPASNSATSLTEPLPDLISWCVEDIIGKLKNVSSFFEKQQSEKNNFKSVLYSDFLSEAANNLTRDLLDMSKSSDDYYGLNTLLESDDPKEFFGNLATIISFVPELAENFIEYTVAIYLGLCTKFYLLADSQILSLSKTLA